MTAQNVESPSRASTLLAWLGRVNSQVSQWASSVSWWRLMLLFLLILMAGSILSEILNLKHDRVRVAGKDGDVVVRIGGKDGIRITKDKNGNRIVLPSPPAPPVPGAAGMPGTPGEAAKGKNKSNDEDSDDEDSVDVAALQKEIQKEIGKEMVVGNRVVTWRGILGDIGSALMVLLFAYLVASKIIVKKVAQADAKVRTAVDAAEREAMERQLVQAKLQVLQAQVEPHFLFNTLSTVDYLIETDPPRASRMQKTLISYLRGALPQMREGSSTLGREVRLIRAFLELIKMRIEERLDFEIAVPDGIESAEFPPLMLQSLVENAIKHGIEPKPGGGKVRVAAGIQNAQLWVEVSDTGVGVPDGELLDGPTSGTGIGLQNIRERLAMLYPGKSRLMLRSDPATGTVVKISIPYQVGPDVIAAEHSAEPQQKPA